MQERWNEISIDDDNETDQETWQVTGDCKNTEVQPFLHGEFSVIQVLFCQQSASDSSDL